MSENVETMEISNSKQDSFESCPLSRASELNCRSPIKSKDSEQSGFESDFQYLGETNGTSFCIEMESQDSNLLFLDSRSECTSSRCVVNYMEQHDGLICISSNMSNFKTSHVHEKVSSVK